MGAKRELRRYGGLKFKARRRRSVIRTILSSLHFANVRQFLRRCLAAFVHVRSARLRTCFYHHGDYCARHVVRRLAIRAYTPRALDRIYLSEMTAMRPCVIRIERLNSKKKTCLAQKTRWT